MAKYHLSVLFVEWHTSESGPECCRRPLLVKTSENIPVDLQHKQQDHLDQAMIM